MSTSLKTQRARKNEGNPQKLQKCHGLKRMGFIEKLRKKLSFTAKKKNTPKNEDETPTSEALKWRDFSEFPCFFGSPCVLAMRFLEISSDRFFGPPGPGIFRTVHGFVHTEDHMFADLP